MLPGETLHVALTLTGRSVTPIDFISIDFHSTNGTRNPLQNTWFEQHELFHTAVEVAGAGELREGPHRYRASFEIPDSLPPTYLGAAIEHHAWNTVRAAIPWWFDVCESHEVTIAPHPVARPVPVAVAGSSLRASEPFVEVSLGAQRFAPGRHHHERRRLRKPRERQARVLRGGAGLSALLSLAAALRGERRAGPYR